MAVRRDTDLDIRGGLAIRQNDATVEGCARADCDRLLIGAGRWANSPSGYYAASPHRYCSCDAISPRAPAGHDRHFEHVRRKLSPLPKPSSEC